MKIILNNSVSQIVTNTTNLVKIRESKAFALRVQGAFFSNAFRKNNWDGKKRFITNTGQLPTGLIPYLLRHIHDEYGDVDIDVVDNRSEIPVANLSKKIGPDLLRDDQYDILKALIDFNIAGIPFPRGVVDVATNFGKTYLAAGIFKAYNVNGALFLGDADLYQQLRVDLERLLPGEVGWMDSKSTHWNKFMVIMIKTCHNRMKSDPTVKNRLQALKVCIVDEADLSTSKTYMDVLNVCHNAPVKVGLTGTAFRGRDKIKNLTFRGIFGDRIAKVSNAQLIREGKSSPIKVFVYPVPENPKAFNSKLDYPAVYSLAIINNKGRNKLILKHVKALLRRKIKPILVFTKYHEHIQVLMKMLEKADLKGASFDWVHGKRDSEERRVIRREFREGRIDVLVASNVFNRGKNLPLTKAIINAAAGTSETQLLQGPIGRATRIHSSKKRTLIIDYYDRGKYVELHSKRRVIFYKNEQLPVKELYKGKKK